MSSSLQLGQTMAQRDLLWALVRRWRLIAGCALLGLALGIAQVLVTDVAYRADATVAPVVQRKDLLDELGGLGLGDVLGLLPTTSGGKEAERMVATLLSNQFTYRFIEDRGLAPELFPERWDAESRTWKPSSLSWLPIVADRARAPTAQELVKQFASMRSISLDRPTGLVRIRLDWHTPKRSAELVNSMIADFNEFSRARAREEAHTATEYLVKEMDATNVAELRGSIARLMEDQMTREMMATVQPEFALRVVDPAMAPDRPVRPRYLVITVLWLLASVTIALTVLIVRLRYLHTPRHVPQ